MSRWTRNGWTNGRDYHYYVTVNEPPIREGGDMSETIECPTCFGSGNVHRIGDRFLGWPISTPCPDCVNSRQPTPEVLERMAKAIYAEEGESDPEPWDEINPADRHWYLNLALAAWLAEHKEKT